MNTTSGTNYILETIKKIDKLQRSSLTDTNCGGCNGFLAPCPFNTKPVRFTLCGGVDFTSTIPTTGLTTTLFRIEEVRGNYLVLRLLNEVSDVITCTPNTCILSLSCVCALQCLDPINCTLC